MYGSRWCGVHMPVVKVTRKYQITIPRAIRETLNINVGDMLLVRKDSDRIVIGPIVRRDRKLWRKFSIFSGRLCLLMPSDLLRSLGMILGRI